MWGMKNYNSGQWFFLDREKKWGDKIKEIENRNISYIYNISIKNTDDI